MRGIPQEIIEEVRRRSSLLEIIGDLPKLKKTPKGYIACCPFHDDSSPSFSINDDEGLFLCFGCGKKGTIFDYVMETKRLTFAEAVKFLANRVGITISENTGLGYEQGKIEREKKHKVLQGAVLAAAVNAYRDCLLTGAGARLGQDYLRSRGIKPETAEKFKLGFAPNSWDFITEQVSGKTDAVKDREELVKVLCEIGLLKIKNDDGVKSLRDDKVISINDYTSKDTEAVGSAGRVYDAYRNRIIFPIFRSDGVPIALGGRIITQDKNAPKYINSPESLIYQKRKALYGLSQGMDAIRRQKQVFLVEGYLDVISMHQLGIANVVASCGTAVTDEHVLVLKRLAGKVVALFDADLAGKKAAANCFSLFINSGVEVTAVTLPEGEDPDSFAKNNSLSVVEEYLNDTAVPAVDVFLDYLLLSHGFANKTDYSFISGKISEEFIRAILPVKNPVEQEALMRRACDKLGTSLESMKLLFAQTWRQVQQGKSFRPQPTPIQSRGDRPRSPVFASPDSPSTDKTPSFTTEVAERKKPTAAKSTVRPEDLLSEQLWRDLIIALLVKPGLAGKIFAMDPFANGEVMINLMPRKVRDFVTDISQEIRYGVDNGESARSEIRAFLQKHSLNADYLINAALRSVAIKDLNQENVVNETHRRVAEHIVKFRLSEINRSIGSVTDEEKAVLLTEKTMLAKKLHRIS